MEAVELRLPVRFLGGALGGQHERLPREQVFRGYRVPVVLTRPMQAVGNGYDKLPPLPPLQGYASEDYRYEGQQDKDGTYVMRWQRPDIEGLHRKIDRLEAELEVLKTPPPRKGLMRFAR